jgi:hypothetical protein
MLRPLIQRRQSRARRSGERGVTMALVALSMLAVISMAAISIDLGSLYEAEAEAQRAADLAALAAARVIALEGITGDPTNVSGSWQLVCGGTSSPASLAATGVAQQNLIGGDALSAAQVTVTYGSAASSGPNLDCSTLTSQFGINPIVNVVVQRSGLPIFFARVFSLVNSRYSNASVSASASAEAYNASNSASVAGSIVPVRPRCVKPLIVPNYDPVNATTLVSNTDGSITKPGLFTTGVIGETFQFTSACAPGSGAGCTLSQNPPPLTAGTMQYVPGLIQGTPRAVPSCAAAGFQAAVAGCDESTIYACGVSGGNYPDLSENPVNPSVLGGDTDTAIGCLIQSASSGYNGGDQIITATYPFAIEAGQGNPLVQNGVVNNNDPITSSNSIVAVPIYDNSSGSALANGAAITVIGFVQLFIGPTINVNGSLRATVMNVVGCGNGTNTTSGFPDYGTSPVPIRLITSP